MDCGVQVRSGALQLLRESVRWQRIALGARVSKTGLLLAIALPLLLADCATKRAAVQYLQPPHTPHNVIGTTVRLTLGYNRQAAMSVPAGPNARWVLSATTVIGLLVLGRLLRATGPRERARGIGLALLIGGATGNLLSRVTDSRGVVDFLDVGFGAWRFWTFNLADIGISAGAALLVLALWRAAPRPPGATRQAGAAT